MNWESLTENSRLIYCEFLFNLLKNFLIYWESSIIWAFAVIVSYKTTPTKYWMFKVWYPRLSLKFRMKLRPLNNLCKTTPLSLKTCIKLRPLKNYCEPTKYCSVYSDSPRLFNIKCRIKLRPLNDYCKTPPLFLSISF